MSQIIKKIFNNFYEAADFVNKIDNDDINYYDLKIMIDCSLTEKDILFEGFNHSQKIKEISINLSVANPSGSIVVFKNCLFGNLIITKTKECKCFSFLNSRSLENTRISIKHFNKGEEYNKLRIDISEDVYDSSKFLSFDVESTYSLTLKENSEFGNIKNSIFKEFGEVIIEARSVKFDDCTFLQQVNLNIGKSLIFYDCKFNGNINLENSDKESFNKLVRFEKGEISSDSFEITDIDVNFLEVNFLGSILRVKKGRESSIKGYDLIKNANKISIESCKNLKIFLASINSLSIKNLKKEGSFFTKIECPSGIQELELNDCEITNFVLSGQITDKAIFNKVTFENPPEIGDIKFKNCNVEFRDIKFKDINSPGAIAGFRALNKACRDANYHHGEIFFHGLTLKGIGKNLKLFSKDFVEKILSFGYNLFSDYGRGSTGPLICLIIISFAIMQYNKSIVENKELLINYNHNSYILESSKAIIENSENNDCETQKINKKIIFKNAIGPLQLALQKEFIKEDEIKCYNSKTNFFIKSLNFIHAVISYAIWFVWFFMIRARFKL